MAMTDFLSPEGYMHTEYGGWGPGGTCDCCGSEEQRLTAGVPTSGDDWPRNRGKCQRCVSSAWGYDRAEHLLVTGMLGGVIRSALEVGASPDLVHGAVQKVLDENRDEMEVF